MKTFLLIIAFLALSFASAQEPLEKLIIKKGTWNIRGNTSVYFQNSKGKTSEYQIFSKTSVNTFLIAPSFGYALKNNLVIGLGLQYLNQKTKSYRNYDENTYNSKYKNNSIGLTPYIRSYKGIGKQLALYLQGEIGYNRFWQTNDQNDSSEINDTTGNNLFIGIRPGITYFIGQKLAIEASYGSLGYSYVEMTYDNSNYTKRNTFDLNLNTSNLLFGLAYYF